MPGNIKKEYKIDISSAQPKQIEFFKARERFVAYGGARGGGKSWALRKKLPLMCLKYPGIKILLLRRTYPDLFQNHTKVFLVELDGIATYSDKNKMFKFVNGSELILGYCATERDALQYQGQEYDVIALDEATQFTETQFSALKASLRGANNFPKRFYLTCNPGGVGHTWVKRLFISRKFTPFEKPEEYTFIPATVFDNKVLLESDEGYVDMLNSLPEGMRQAWRDGNWDMLAGQYFDEFNRSVHVCAPFEIPEHWKKYRAIDYGLDCLACVWCAVDEHGNYYIYRDYAKPDMIISEGSAEINALSADDGKIDYTYAPPDLWGRSQETGKCRADLFLESGLRLDKASNDREAGWLAIKELLKVSVTGEEHHTRLHIFSNCETLIECLPALQRDAKHPTDCCIEPHDITHLPDALRYLCISFISKSQPKKEEKTAVQKYKESVFKNTKRHGRSYF